MVLLFHSPAAARRLLCRELPETYIQKYRSPKVLHSSPNVRVRFRADIVLIQRIAIFFVVRKCWRGVWPASHLDRILF